MDFLVGIHTKDYNGTPNKKGEIDFVMTGIKVLKLPEMIFSDIMFKDYTDYSNDELYSLLDSIKGWKYSKRLYRDKDILYVSYYQCNTLHYGGISLFNYSDCIPLFCSGKLLSSKDDKLVITQSSDSVFYGAIIYVNLTDYKVGIIVDDHYIFGDVKFKSLYYDFDYDKGSGNDKLRERYDKSFLEIYLGDDAYSIKDVVPIDYEDGGLLIIGDKCILDIDSRYNGKSIIVLNGIKDLILSINENELGTDTTIVFPPSIQKLFLDSDSIISYSDINTKFILSKKSNIDSILYYLYNSAYYIPEDLDLKDKVEKHSINKNNLSYRDRVFDFIKNNKDEMVGLLSSLGLSIDFYGG